MAKKKRTAKRSTKALKRRPSTKRSAAKGKGKAFQSGAFQGLPPSASQRKLSTAVQSTAGEVVPPSTDLGISTTAPEATVHFRGTSSFAQDAFVLPAPVPVTPTVYPDSPRRRKRPIPPNAPQHEEIRFAKNAQRAITAGGIGILFVIYQTANFAKPLSTGEAWVVFCTMLVTVLLSFLFIWEQQQHLAAKRQELDPEDVDGFRRDIHYPLIYHFAMIGCSILFLYLLHRSS